MNRAEQRGVVKRAAVLGSRVVARANDTGAWGTAARRARRAANQQRGKRMRCFTTRAGGAQAQQEFTSDGAECFQVARRGFG